MVWKKHDYDDIPGTYVFDGETAHASFNINKIYLQLRRLSFGI